MLKDFSRDPARGDSGNCLASSQTKSGYAHGEGLW
jgi:hypothetical protein